MNILRNFMKEIKERVLIFDGSKGYMLQEMGMVGGECPELWNVTHPDEVRKIYSLYKEAGANVIQTNTFQGSRMILEKYGLGDRTFELNFEGARLAKEVMGNGGYVAASIGPLGKLFEPLGELTFDNAYSAFKEQVQALVDGGVDIINFETFTDLAEMRAALLAAKETCNLPVICSMAFEENGRTLMGTDPYVVVSVLKSLGADMVGTNCSFGSVHMLNIVKVMHEAGGIYLSAKPNAGLPELIDGVTIYSEKPAQFAAVAGEYCKLGVRLFGGCCGTTPEFIKEIKSVLTDAVVPKLCSKTEQIITSGVKLLNLGNSKKINTGYLISDKSNLLIDEKIKNSLEYIVDKALEIACEGYDAIYINADRINGSGQLLANIIDTAQGYIKEPFIIETKKPQSLANALRIYRGKAGVVVNGCNEKLMEELIIIARKYGSTIVDKSIIISEE